MDRGRKTSSSRIRKTACAASALELVALYADIAVLSFDRRIIGNLEGLGLATAP
jgi:hypothetical protein